MPAPQPPPRRPVEDDDDGDLDEDDFISAKLVPRATPEPEPPPTPTPLEPEPLPTDLHAFWAGESPPDTTLSEIRIPQLHAALARRLGGFSFWRGRDECETIFERAYRNASIAGLDVYLGDTGESDSS